MLNLIVFARLVVGLRSYGIVGIVSFITAFGLYYEIATVSVIHGGSHSFYDVLFQRNDMSLMLGKLTLYFIYKFFATAFCVTLPIPVGLFTPIFLTGGVLGRVIGKPILTSHTSSSYLTFSAYSYRRKASCQSTV